VGAKKTNGKEKIARISTRKKKKWSFSRKRKRGKTKTAEPRGLKTTEKAQVGKGTRTENTIPTSGNELPSKKAKSPKKTRAKHPKNERKKKFTKLRKGQLNTEEKGGTTGMAKAPGVAERVMDQSKR